MFSQFFLKKSRQMGGLFRFQDFSFQDIETKKTKLLCPSDLVCDTERNKDTTVLCIFMERTGCNIQDYVMTKHKRLVPDKTSVIHVNRYTKRGRPYRKRSH